MLPNLPKPRFISSLAAAMRSASLMGLPCPAVPRITRARKSAMRYPSLVSSRMRRATLWLMTSKSVTGVELTGCTGLVGLSSWVSVVSAFWQFSPPSRPSPVEGEGVLMRSSLPLWSSAVEGREGSDRQAEFA